MWMWRLILVWSLTLACLALDSNTIRSSKETIGSHGNPGEKTVQRRTETTLNSNRRTTQECSTSDCYLPTGACSNRAQRRGLSSQDRETDSQRDRETDRQSDTSFNRTKAAEMSSCVRSGDCEVGLCCVRYLTGKRCQRIPTEGDACLLRGSTKLRRNLGRCDCGPGLSCAATVGPSRAKGQGVCQPRPQKKGQRKTRHSGYKRRMAERGC